MLTLQVADARDVLARVVVTLHRRNCRITHLEFTAPERGASGTLTVEADVPASHAHCLEHWVRRLMDVIDVIDVSPPPDERAAVGVAMEAA